MKRSENRIQSMILIRKVVSLRNICLNESRRLYTLQIYSFYKSRVATSHTYMEISLNLMCVTDFFYKQMLTSLISFPSGYTFSLNLLLKASVIQAKNYEFFKFFLRGQPFWLRDVSETSECPSQTLFRLSRDLFILIDSDQEHVGHCINKFTETGLDFFIKYLLRAI